VINKLNTELEAVLKLPETSKRFAIEGAEVETMTPPEIRKFVLADLAKWAKVAQDAKMEKH
jgi:tripartite-type tricarboxylate transporter receptor subunit TctC